MKLKEWASGTLPHSYPRSRTAATMHTCEIRPRKDHRGVDLICASKIPNDLAQFALCSLLIAFPSQRQEIGWKCRLFIIGSLA
jgi:hypothetical protein